VKRPLSPAELYKIPGNDRARWYRLCLLSDGAIAVESSADAVLHQDWVHEGEAAGPLPIDFGPSDVARLLRVTLRKMGEKAGSS